MKLADLSRPAGLRASAAYVEELEALRGLAVILVAASHFLPWLHEGLPGTPISPAYALLIGGHTGVSLFFVLSAFLLSRPFLEARQGGRPVSIRDFYRRRALRILPLYYVAIVVAFMLSLSHLAHPSRVAAYFAFLQVIPGVPPMPPYSNVWWSLCTEVQFYLFLPFLALALRPGRGRFIAAMSLGLCAVAYVAVAFGWIGWGPPPLLDSHGAFGRAPLFACGVLAAWLYGNYGTAFRRWADGSRAIRFGGGDLVLVAALWSLGTILQRVHTVGYYVAEWIWPSWHVAEGFAWTVVLWLLLTTPLRLKALLANWPLRVLGVLSYSIYIVHLPLAEAAWNLVCRDRSLSCIGWTPHSALALAVFTGSTVALSALSYALIERPFLRRKGG